MAEDISSIMSAHRFFAQMSRENLRYLHKCVRSQNFRAGSFLGREGDPSAFFFALIDGRVAIESYQPGLKPIVVQSLQSGDIVGWSWLFPPFKWVFDARALTDTQTLAFDAEKLRDECESHPGFGYELVKRFAQVMTQRLRAARLQVLDIYDYKNPPVFKGEPND